MGADVGPARTLTDNADYEVPICMRHLICWNPSTPGMAVCLDPNGTKGVEYCPQYTFYKGL